MKQAYEQAYEKGKSYVSDLQEKEDDAADVYQQLEKLGKLKAQGILSDEEFETKKKELLARI
jgi:predicted Zn-dependent peptidase